MLEIFGFNAFSMSRKKPRLMLILMLATPFNAFFFLSKDAFLHHNTGKVAG